MINSILLTNFTGFANNRFDFTEGVNVLIGKNGAGHGLQSAHLCLWLG